MEKILTQVICPTSDEKMNVEHFISEMTHKPKVLKFWIIVFCLSHLYDICDVPSYALMTQQLVSLTSIH